MISLRSPLVHAVLWTILVGIGMLLPGDALPPIGSWLPASLEQWVDKIEHLVAFLIMMILVFRALRLRSGSRSPMVTAAALTLGYAVLLEVLQIPHPSRYWSPADIVADAIGVGFGVLIVMVLARP